MPKAKRPGQLLPVDAGREPGLERWRGQAGGADVAVRTDRRRDRDGSDMRDGPDLTGRRVASGGEWGTLHAKGRSREGVSAGANG